MIIPLLEQPGGEPSSVLVRSIGTSASLEIVLALLNLLHDVECSDVISNPWSEPGTA